MALRRRKAGRRPTLNVLLSCVGRRVELVQAFRAAGEELKIDLKLHGTDVSSLAPAMHHVDQAHQVSPIAHRNYLSDLLELIERHRIHLLVPTIDTELLRLADARSEFADRGCTATVSAPEVVHIGRDKLLTCEKLQAAKIDTPKTWPAAQAVRRQAHKFPYQIKPRYGSAGKGNVRVDDLAALKYWGRRVPEAVVQEFVSGVEYTLDVYAGLDGQVRCVVPRQRLEVRAGEVQKARVVKDPELIEIGRHVVESIGACIGVITVQCIRTPRGRIRVIEINPRFGGGAPLAIHAGANFPKWLLTEVRGEHPRIRMDGYRDGVCMLRYDQSVFLDRMPPE